MGEQTFFNEGQVQVTRSRVVIGSQTYPIQGITTISMRTTPAQRGGSIVVGGIGVLVLLGGLGDGNGSLILVSLVLIGLAVLFWRRAKPVYHLFFGTAGADKQALSSNDVEFIRRVSNAINEALISRG